jgi:hypothetical protein
MTQHLKKQSYQNCSVISRWVLIIIIIIIIIKIYCHIFYQLYKIDSLMFENNSSLIINVKDCAPNINPCVPLPKETV